MGLPKLNVTVHELTLPFSKETIEYRAMTVGEEKILSIAKSSEDPKQIVIAIKQVIKNCTYDKLNPETIALVDFEFLFLWIRIHSKGEVSELKIACMEEKCGNMVEVDIDLTQYKLKNFETDNKVALSDTIGLVMKSPTLNIMNSVMDKSLAPYEQNIAVIKNCIDYVYDGDDVTVFADCSNADQDDFIAGFETSKMKLIKKYVDNLPAIFYEVEYKCLKCGHTSKRTIEGIDNFF